MELNRKHQATLDAVFVDPTRSNVVWLDIEAMLAACEVEVTEGQGSRAR